MSKLNDISERNYLEIKGQKMDLENSEDYEDETETLLTNHEESQYYCDSDFKINLVPDPKIIHYTLESFFAVSSTDQMKLDPDYQRDVVWDEGRSSALIASIFQGYFIPPIIFNIVLQDHKSGDGSQVLCRICVDGKQRITSLRDFMEGRIGVLDSGSPPKKWYFCHPIINGIQHVSSHNILSESIKKHFKSRTFCCFEYQNLPKSVEENMFQLVQRGVPLTPGERMRALSTNWATFGKKIEQDYPQVMNLSKQSRASGFKYVITIFIQVREVISQRESKDFNGEWDRSSLNLCAAPQALHKMLVDEESLEPNEKIKYKEVFDNFQKLVDLSSMKSSDTKLGYTLKPNSVFHPTPDYLNNSHVKTFSPLELVATATLIAVHGASRPSAALLDSIKYMRITLRNKHQDLRLNSHCWATAWNFISKWGVGDGQAASVISPGNEESDGEQVAVSRRIPFPLGPISQSAGSYGMIGETNMDIDE